MVKYRCVRADNATNVMYDLDRTRTYIEDGIQNARKRAMKMIHGDKSVCVLIYLDSDFKKYPWIGYLEKVMLDSKDIYATYGKNGYVLLNRDGTPKSKA